MQVITGVSVNGAHESDQNAVTPMLDQLADSGMMPEELLEDTLQRLADLGLAVAITELDAPVEDDSDAQLEINAQRMAKGGQGLPLGCPMGNPICCIP